MSKTTEEYLLRITSQYQNSTNFLNWLSKPINLLQELVSCAEQLPQAFDLDEAVGAQLDTLGVLIGQSRTLPFDPTDGSSSSLDDATYRTILKLKTMTNYWDGSLGTIYDAWNSLFTEASLRIIDHQNMTADVVITGEMSQIVLDMIYNDMVLPRPEGVRYFYGSEAPPTTAKWFTLLDDPDTEEYTEYEDGFDLGYWDTSIT
jgi:hypothetical protein